MFELLSGEGGRRERKGSVRGEGGGEREQSRGEDYW